MTPRPIHRWKSFWLGIFILIFLGWAWAISISRVSEALLNVPGHGLFALRQFNGQIALLHDSSSAAHSWKFKTASAPGFIHQAYHDAWREAYSAIGVILVTHAQLIIAFLLTWSAFLLWRWRKARHLTNQSHLPSPAP